MTLRSILIASLLLLPLLATTHNFVDDQRVTSVGVTNRRELILDKDKFGYKDWNSSQLMRKVRVIQHIAGRSSTGKKNANLIEAIKAAGFPYGRYQAITIVNADDAIPGTDMFMRSSIEDNKKLFSQSQFIVGGNGLVRKVWQLNGKSSVIAVLDENGCAEWAKDGALTRQKVQQVIGLLRRLLSR